MSDALTESERAELLQRARQAIQACLGGDENPLGEASSRLREPAGAFVTIRRRSSHELRGCIGYIEPRLPLAETVARAACIAATEDTRFLPVTLDELPALLIEISVLDRPRRVQPEEVEVGRHGVIIGHKQNRGLLLPQVAVEYGWDRETFLDHACLKAGLPAGTWRRSDAEIQVFSAVVFSEDSA
ncbi:MAG: AmmeMemoRadiSam system protein A [Vicinamibacteria bacterium]|nr:AmmeMemoRadiSam system protein A [Vicinamibacteria bacterium]